MRRAFVAAGVALVALTAAAPAAAHPSLVQSSPVAGLSSARAPRELALSLSEHVSARGSRIVVTGPRGRRVPVSRIVARRGDVLAAALPAGLRPGVYDVRWSVLGADGHVVSGDLRFGVSPRGGGPPPGAERLGAASGPGARGSASSGEGFLDVGLRWVALLGAALLLGGDVLRWRRVDADAARRRRVSRVALAVVFVACAETVASIAADDPGLLTGTAHGRLALARLACVVLGAVAAPGAAAALVLAGFGLDGHLQAVGDGRALATVAAVAHVLAAGLWAGGLLALVVLRVPVRAGVRAYAPVAAGAAAVLALTGVVAALREVDGIYFLRWSAYGNVVAVKAVLLVVLSGLGAAVTLGRGRRLLRVEALGAAGVLLLAAALAGLVQGRGQPVAAQQGNLLGGPALATASAPGGLVKLTVAPARPGVNELVALGGARDARVRLACACGARPVDAVLRGGRASVRLPAAGTWYATLRGGVAPAALAVGDRPVRGPRALEVVQSADLSGRDAERCRAHAQGVALAVGRLNAGGGADGGRKVALRTEDDGGVAARAAAIVRAARARGAVAVVAPCGAGAGAALRAAGDLPALVSDPAAPLVAGRRVFRVAGDPRAEGFAVGRYVAEQGVRARPDGPRRVAAVLAPGGGADARERLAGLRDGLAAGRIGLDVRAWRGGRALARDIAPARYLATWLDGGSAPLAAALRAIGARDREVVPDAILAASPLVDERFQRGAGVLGRLGAVRSPAEIVFDSRDALSYAALTEALYPGDRPSAAGLRGYVAGLALAEGLRDGAGADDIAARLHRPRRFTDALASPWRDDAPARGAQRFTIVAPQFLPPGLIPTRAGGMAYTGRFFPDGAWTRLSGDLYGPDL